MKILHTADWHIGKLLEGRSRLEEQRILLRQLAQMAEAEEADVVCVAGDIFDNGHPSAAAEALFYETIKELSKNGERLVVIIGGNHDQPSRLEAVNPLVREHGILIFGSPTSQLPSGTYGTFQIQSLDPGVFSFTKNQERAVFACVPYFSERTLNEVLYQEETDDAKRAGQYSQKAEELFKKRAAWFSPDSINVLMSHVFTLGSAGDESEQGMMLGNSYLLPANVFPPSAQYIALGHIHRPQKVPGSGGQIRYSGSPLPYRLMETAVAKQCLLAELHPGKKPVVKELFFDNPKPIEKWVCDDYAQALEKCRENQERSCYVYLYIRTDSYIREEQLKELKSYKEDLLEIVPLFSSREEEDTYQDFRQMSFEELFIRYYTEKKGTAPQQEVLETLAGILEKEKEYETDTIEDKGSEQLSGASGD